MINHITLVKKLKAFGHPPDTWLPWDYQRANPKGRWLHDDWVLFKSTPRISTAYAVPLPFKKIAGNAEPVWMPIRNPAYPLAPGAETKVAPFNFGDGTKDYRWVLTMMSIHDAGFWSRQTAFIGGAWVECYYTRSWSIFGKRFTWYDGLKLDQDGPMCWYPEASASLKNLS